MPTTTTPVVKAVEKTAQSTILRELQHSLTESLTLGTTQAISEPPFALNAEPLQTLTCKAQTITATTASPSPANVSTSQPIVQTQTFNKIGPRAGLKTDTITARGKPVDIYMIIDNTTGMLGTPAKDRALQAVTNLLTQVYDTDWHLFVGGIVNDNGTQKMATYSKTTNGVTNYQISDLPSIATAINNTVLTNDASDYAPLFRSLLHLRAAYIGNARSTAITAAYIVSNATNCTVIQAGAQKSAGNCHTTPGYADNYNSWADVVFGGANDYRNSVNLFGGLYEVSANASVCGSFYVPENNTGLVHTTAQIAELAYNLELINYPGTTPTAPASYVGDLCAASQDWSSLSRFGSAILDEATYRFVAQDGGGMFDFPNEGFPLQIVNAPGGVAGQALQSGQYTLIGGPGPENYTQNMVVRVLDGGLANSTIGVDYYQDTGFRSNTFGLSYQPDPGRGVTVAWSGGSRTCQPAPQNAPSFSAGVDCQWYSTNLFVNLAALPAVAPGASLSFTVSYTNMVTNVTSLVLNTASPLLTVAPYDTVTLYQSVNNGAPQAINVKFTKAASQIVFSMPNGEIFPTGTYSAKVYTQNDTNGVCDLPANTLVASGTPQLLCFRNDGHPALDATTGQLSLTAGAAYPCSLSGSQVSYTGILTPDATDKSTALKVAYRTQVASVAAFTLQKLPDANSLLVGISDGKTTKALTTKDYTLNGRFLTLAAALAPGQSISLSYTVTVPLSTVNCLALTAKAIDKAYTVTYGVTGEETPIDAAKYSITYPLGDDKPPLVCLAPGIADFNHTMIVAYTDTDAKSSTTVTP